MIAYLFNNAELNFGEHGDFIFDGQDISILRDTDKVLYQSVVDFIRTNLNDYSLNRYYGGNLKAHIGKGLDPNTGKTIANKLKNDIISAGLINKQSIDVYSIVNQSVLYLRVVLFNSDDFTAQITINSSGVTVNV